MRCNSIVRKFEPAMSHDYLDELKASMPVTTLLMDRVAEQASRYLPHSEWEREVEELSQLVEDCNG